MIETDPDRRSSPSRRALWLLAWGGVFAFASWSLFAALRGRLDSADLDDDMYFLTAVCVQETHQKGLEGMLDYVFHMRDEYGVPSANLFHWLVIRRFGLDVRAHQLAQVSLHCASAALFLLFLWRGMGLAPLAAALASLFFFVAYAHFHAYLFTVSVQHQMVLAGAFLVLWLFHESERRWEKGNRRGEASWRLAAILAAALTSFLRPTIVLVPLHALLFLAIRGRSEREVRERCGRWWILPLVYVPFRAWSLAVGGEGIHLQIPHAISRGFGPWLVALAFAAIGTGVAWHLPRWAAVVWSSLSAVRERLKGCWSSRLTLLSVLAAFFLLSKAPTLFLLAKLAVVPGWSLVKSDSLFSRWEVIRLPGDGGGGLSAAEAAVILGTGMLLGWMWRSAPGRLVFMGWLGVGWAASSRFGEHIPSRYFIYLTPVVAVFLATFVVEIPRSILALRSRALQGTHAVAVVALALWIAQVQTETIGRRLSFTKRQGTLIFYRQARIAHLVEEDLRSHPEWLRRVERDGSALHVRGVPSAWFLMTNRSLIAPDWDPWNYHPFKYLLGAAGRWPVERAHGVRVDRRPSEGEIRYEVRGKAVLDPEGRNIDPFYAAYDAGIDAWKRGDAPNALARLEEAVRTEPFFIRHFFGARGAQAEFARIRRSPVDLIAQAEHWTWDAGEEEVGFLLEEVQDYLVGAAVCGFLRFEKGDVAGARRHALRFHEAMGMWRKVSPERFEAIARFLRDLPQGERIVSWLSRAVPVDQSVRWCHR